MTCGLTRKKVKRSRRSHSWSSLATASASAYTKNPHAAAWECIVTLEVAKSLQLLQVLQACCMVFTNLGDYCEFKFAKLRIEARVRIRVSLGIHLKS